MSNIKKYFLRYSVIWRLVLRNIISVDAEKVTWTVEAAMLMSRNKNIPILSVQITWFRVGTILSIVPLKHKLGHCAISARSPHYMIYSSYILNNYGHAQLSHNEKAYCTILDPSNPYKMKTRSISIFSDLSQQPRKMKESPHKWDILVLLW